MDMDEELGGEPDATPTPVLDMCGTRVGRRPSYSPITGRRRVRNTRRPIQVVKDQSCPLSAASSKNRRRVTCQKKKAGTRKGVRNLFGQYDVKGS